MGGIARANKMKALAVGGIEDHAHVSLSLPPDIAVTKAIQLVKSGSSKWMHEKVGTLKFDWQEGYSASSIGVSQAPATIRYILNQPKHHVKVTFEDEWKTFLERHGLELAVPDGTLLFDPKLTRHLNAHRAKCTARVLHTGLFSVAPSGARFFFLSTLSARLTALG